jgi:acyl carrier protein
MTYLIENKRVCLHKTGSWARTEGSIDINKLRVLIAEHLQVDVRRVTDDAHLSRDLGADWLDRLELIILVEEIAGVEIYGQPLWAMS